MSYLKIQDPDNYIFASTVIKHSKTGLSSNRRLLVIKGGHLYYYSNIPKGFIGDPKILQYFHELPKSSISISIIKKIITPGKNSVQFELIFDAKHMIQRQQIRKTLTSQNYSIQPKNTKQQISWKFSCDNQAIKQKWINVIVTMSKHYQQEEEQIKKYFSNQSNADQQINFRASVKNPWRESTIQRKNLNDVKGFNEMVFDESKKQFQQQKTMGNKKMSLQQFQKPHKLNAQTQIIKIQDAFNNVNMKKKIHL